MLCVFVCLQMCGLLQVQAGAGAQPELDPATRQHHQYMFGSIPTPVVDVNNLTSAPIVATRSVPPTNLPLVTTEIIKKRLEDRYVIYHQHQSYLTFTMTPGIAC